MIRVRCPYCGAELVFLVGTPRCLALFCVYCGAEWFEDFLDGCP